MEILNERIEKANTICILGHQNPDGDCIGSALSLYHYINNKYDGKKKVKIYLTEFSDKFMILPSADKISHDTNDADPYDLCIVVDSGATARFKDFERYFNEAKDTMVFDHHEDNTIPAKITICDPTSISTCEILYDYLDKEYIDVNIAKCLFVGLATDSGVFRYKDVSKKTFNLAGELCQYDFDKTELIDKIVFENSLNQRKAQSIVFDRIKLLCHGKVSFSYILDEELDSLNLKKPDIDNMIVYLREMTGIVVAAFLYPTGHNIFKMSLRSKVDSIDVAEFARMHDGGGHKMASGCLYYGEIDNIAEVFAKDIAEFIDGKI